MESIDAIPCDIKHRIYGLCATGVIGPLAQGVQNYRLLSMIHTLQDVIIRIAGGKSSRKSLQVSDVCPELEPYLSKEPSGKDSLHPDNVHVMIERMTERANKAKAEGGE